MICKNCELWLKRETGKKDNNGRKVYFPTGVCMNPNFRNQHKKLFTVENTNCNNGVKKINV